MIISQTPHRISFFGGGTDYPSYYLKYGGKTLGVAIDKYCYLSVRQFPPFFSHKHRIVYSEQENVNEIEEIRHPSVREVLKYVGIKYGISIHHDGDIPARSGMGSSSAFTVGLLKSVYALEGKIISKEKLMKEAIHIEQDCIGENVGSQDQVFASFGGLNLVEFSTSGEISVEPVIMQKSRLIELESNLLLYFSGISRIASEIAAEQIKNTTKNLQYLNSIKSLVTEGYNVLTNPNRSLDEFGFLLNQTWQLKKRLSDKITNSEIDKLYEKGLKHGAIGGKLLGAGGGGFVLFYVKKEKQKKFREKMSSYLEIPFKFDFDGSKIIVYQP